MCAHGIHTWPHIFESVCNGRCGIRSFLESLYQSLPHIMETTTVPNSAIAYESQLLEHFLCFSRVRRDIHAATTAVPFEDAATANEQLLLLARGLTSASSVALDLWTLSMVGCSDTAIVGAMALADTPRDLGAIWKLLLSINNAIPDDLATTRMRVTISMLLPVLKKSVVVLSRMGTAIEVVLPKSTKLDDMEADTPKRYSLTVMAGRSARSASRFLAHRLGVRIFTP